MEWAKNSALYYNDFKENKFDFLELKNLLRKTL